MAKVKNADKVAANIKRTLTNITKDKRLLDELGQTAVKTITATAKKGRNPDGTSFPAIDSGWNERRKKIAKTNKTDEFFRPSSSKSRLSFTGELLRSIKYLIKGNKLKLFPSGNHSGYRNLDGTKSRPTLNKIIFDGQSKQGRTVFGESKLLTKLLLSEVQRASRRYIANFNKGK